MPVSFSSAPRLASRSSAWLIWPRTTRAPKGNVRYEVNFEVSLLPALGGHWLLTHFIPARTEALRQSGYHIAFRSAVVGLLLFVLAYLVLHSVEACTLWRGHPCLRYTFPANFENAAMTSVALGLLVPYPLNLCFDAGKAEERVAAYPRQGELR